MTKQLSLITEDKLDPQIAKDADRYVEAVKEVKDATERRKKFAGLIVRALKKLGKSKVRHGDIIIEVASKEAIDTIKIKKAKAAPVKKVQPIKAPEKK
jgi:hypothetical protein